MKPLVSLGHPSGGDSFMHLVYEGKRTAAEVLAQPVAPIAQLPDFGASQFESLLLQGDNRAILAALHHYHGFAGTVDLVYIDPPYNTGSVFRIDRERTATVSSRRTAAVAYSDNLTLPQFLAFIRDRLILLRELMSDRGSIYVHIDYKVGHYIKILMDEVFGVDNFRNDISRIKCNPKNFSRIGYGNIKDMILFYSKTASPIWNEPRVPIGPAEAQRRYSRVDGQGRRYTTVPLHAPGETADGATGMPWRGRPPPPGRHWRCAPALLDELDAAGHIEWSSNGNPRIKKYAEEAMLRGKKMQDIWEFKDLSYPQYPTQKNSSLLETIVQASSLPGSIVLDCFCGSGTTLLAAASLGRSWIGIDQSDAAIAVSQKRLAESGISPSSYQFLRLGQP